MNYISTRNSSLKVSGAQAIVTGLSPEGGLFVPEEIPALTDNEFSKLLNLSYPQLAANIMAKYLSDFSEDELLQYTQAAYGPGRFDSYDTAPVKLADGKYFLELWHGPTCAFKDMALQILPYLLTASMKKCGEKRTVCILVATSGDTGKAALEGFRDVPGTRIMVFYPRDGVSDVQKLQMASQQGNNVSVYSVVGNFDDAQTGVKEIFSDKELEEVIGANGFVFSSANSINWGRLLPQIVYYIHAYLELVRRGNIKYGDKLDFAVPTGNFGDILAGWFAKKMGLPVGRLICASNKNDVLTQFINTGVYNKKREFYLTSSPSMDILVSSNLERLLFYIYDKDDEAVARLMKELKENGVYTVSKECIEKIRCDFDCESIDEDGTAEAIKSIFDKCGYLIDTHTAVAYGAAVKKQEKNKIVVVSTASPYKFAASVLEDLGQTAPANGLEAINELSVYSATQIPEPIAALAGAQVRFTEVTEPENMRNAVVKFLS